MRKPSTPSRTLVDAKMVGSAGCRLACVVYTYIVSQSGGTEAAPSGIERDRAGPGTWSGCGTFGDGGGVGMMRGVQGNAHSR